MPACACPCPAKRNILPLLRTARGAPCSTPSSDAFAKKRMLRAPVVTVRGSGTLTVTFNSQLSRAAGVVGYSHVAVRHDPGTRQVQFVFSRDELANGGSYALGFNGGSGRKKNSPSRVFSMPRDRAPFLVAGAFQPHVGAESGALVLTIGLAPIG